MTERREALLREIATAAAQLAAEQTASAVDRQSGRDIAVLQSQMNTLLMDGIEPRLRSVESNTASALAKLSTLEVAMVSHLKTHSRVLWLIGSSLAGIAVALAVALIGGILL